MSPNDGEATIVWLAEEHRPLFRDSPGRDPRYEAPIRGIAILKLILTNRSRSPAFVIDSDRDFVMEMSPRELFREIYIPDVAIHFSFPTEE